MNCLASLLFNMVVPDLWYLYSTFIGMLFSMTSNFFLNKVWTFEGGGFRVKKTAIHYSMFLGFSSLGALIQLVMVYALVENFNVGYPPALIIGVATASVGNFLLNKKWTFREQIWN